MTHLSLRELIQTLWNLGGGPRFSDAELFWQLHADGGVDTEDLSLGDISALLDQSSPSDWHNARFACSEVLASYLVAGREFSEHQGASAVFSACVLADASRANSGDWGVEHDKVMVLIALLGERMDLHTTLCLMAYVFGKGGQLPTFG